MNLGAGQPASLPYGVEPQRWYSYHSMQFSSPLQQSPFSSVCYHPPPLGNCPPPNHYPPPHYITQPNPYPPPLHLAQPNHYPPPHHFTPPNPYPPQLNSYPPPTMLNPYSAYAYQFVPPPICSHEPQPNPQLDQVTDPEVAVVDSSPSSFQFSEARIDEFIESVGRLIDNCIAKCMKGIRVSEGSSPSVPTQTTEIQSSEPRVSSPFPITKSSSPLGDAQTHSISRPHIKQACGEVTSTTGGVKKQRQWKRNKILMRNKSLLKGFVVSSELSNTVSVVSGKDTNLSFMNIGCSGIDFVFGDKLTSVDATCDKEKRKSSGKLEGVSIRQDIQGPNSCEKGRVHNALHLLDKMPLSDELSNAGKNIVGNMSIRDKGGGLPSIHHGIVDTTPVSVDSKVYLVSKDCGSEEKMARDVVPSVHRSLEFGDGRLDDYIGKSVLKPEEYMNGSIGTTLIEKDLAEKLCSVGRNVAASIRDKGGGGHSKGATKNFLRDIVSNWDAASCLSELQVKQVEKKSDIVEPGANNCVKEGMSFDFEFHDGLVTIPAQVHSSYGSTVKDLLDEVNWVFDSVTHPLYKEDNCDFLMDRVDHYMVKSLKDTNELGWRKQELRENAISAISLYVGKAGANSARNKIMILPVPTKSGNSVQITFSLMISLIELWKYGYVDKEVRWLTKISVTSFQNVCFSFNIVQGLIYSGSRFKSFLANGNDQCSVIYCSYLSYRTKELQLYVEVVHKGISRVIQISLSWKAEVDLVIGDITVRTTLYVWLNNNLLCLLFENKWGKMSLSFADNFDDIWERWKPIFIAANEDWTVELHETFSQNQMKIDGKCVGYDFGTLELVKMLATGANLDDSICINKFVLCIVSASVCRYLGKHVYGDEGPIFPNATLHIVRELVSWETVSKLLVGQNAIKETLQVVEGYELPNEGDIVTLELMGKLLDENGTFYLVLVKFDNSTPELEFEKEESYMFIGYIIDKKAYDERWVEGLCELEIDLFKHVLMGSETKTVLADMIREVLKAYAHRRLSGCEVNNALASYSWDIAFGGKNLYVSRLEGKRKDTKTHENLNWGYVFSTSLILSADMEKAFTEFLFATTQGHMLHDMVIEFSSQLNQANACTPLYNYGNREIIGVAQETNEKGANADLASEVNEQPLFLNVTTFEDKLAYRFLTGLSFSIMVLLLCRNGGLMVDNEDVRAAVVHEDGMMIRNADVADGDKELDNSSWKICVYLQLPLLVKKTSSTNCSPMFSIQLEWLCLQCVTYLKLEVKFSEGEWIVMILGLIHSRDVHVLI